MMDCEKFKEHIHDYFSDPDFDWKLRYEIDEHYMSCDECFEVYKTAKMMADPEVKRGTAIELSKIQVEKAEGYLKTKDFEEAIRFFKEANSLNPGDLYIQSKLAVTYLEKGTDLKDIPTEYIVALVHVLKETAEKEFAKEKNYVKAINTYERAFRYRPDDTEIKKMLGLLYNQVGNFNVSIRFLEDVAADLTDDYEVFTVLGDAYSDKREYKLAIEHYEKAYSLKAEAFILSHIGCAYAFLGDLGNAREYIRKAYDLDSYDSLVWNNKGVFHLVASEYSEAIEFLEKARPLFEMRENNRQTAILYDNLAIGYYESGDTKKAKDYSDKALKLDPTISKLKHNHDIIFEKTEGVLMIAA